MYKKRDTRTKQTLMNLFNMSLFPLHMYKKQDTRTQQTLMNLFNMSLFPLHMYKKRDTRTQQTLMNLFNMSRQTHLQSRSQMPALKYAFVIFIAY